MPAGDRQPTELLTDEQAWAREPVRVAHALGHDVVNDAVRGERWTCRRCRFAVLREGCNIYGTAATLPCPGDTPHDTSWVAHDLTARPAGHDWCAGCGAWIKMRADGPIKVHNRSELGLRILCAGSGTNDQTTFVVITHPKPKELFQRFKVTGVVQAALVASSWQARGNTVTVFKQVVRN